MLKELILRRPALHREGDGYRMTVGTTTYRSPTIEGLEQQLVDALAYLASTTEYVDWNTASTHARQPGGSLILIPDFGKRRSRKVEALDKALRVVRDARQR
ncbi:MAG: hypothetical protein WEB00_06620 [Dehalococcoidia bacterium]